MDYRTLEREQKLDTKPQQPAVREATPSSKCAGLDVLQSLIAQHTSAISRTHGNARAVDFEETTTEKLKPIVEKYYDRREQIAASRGLPEDRSAATLSNAHNFKASLDQFIEATSGVLNQRARTVEAKLQARAVFAQPTDPTAQLVHELRKQEIRRELKTLSGEERLNLYKIAADPLVIEAIEDAPPTITRVTKEALPLLTPLIDPAAVAAVKVARARQRDPEAAAELDMFRDMESVYKSSAALVLQTILVEEPDITDQLARTPTLRPDNQA